MRKKIFIFILLITVCISIYSANSNYILKIKTAKDAPISNAVNKGTDYSYRNFKNYPQFMALAWTWQGKPGSYRSLMQFNVSYINDPNIVKKATLVLKGVDHNEYNKPNDFLIQRVTQSWKEDTVTWRTAPSTTTSAQKYLTNSESITQDYRIDITDFVKYWVSHTNLNYGIMLKLQKEEHYTKIGFASSDYSDPDYHPYLEVELTIPNPYKGYYKILDREANKAFDIKLSGSEKYNLQAFDEHGGNNQQFLIAPTGEPNKFFLLSKYTGGAIIGIVKNQTLPEGIRVNNLFYHDGYPTDIAPSPLEIKLHCAFKIMPLFSNSFEIQTISELGVFDRHRTSNNIYLYRNWPHGGDNQRFYVKLASSLEMPQLEEGTNNLSIRFEKPSLSSIYDSGPEEIGRTTISETLIPYVAVKNDQNKNWQIRYSPYYILKRERVYLKANTILYFAGDSEPEQTYNITEGHVYTSGQSEEDLLSQNWTEEGSAQFLIGKKDVFTISGGLKQSYSRTLQTKTVTSESFSTTNAKEVGFKVTFGTQDVRYIVYVVKDIYTLKRMDGYEISSWHIITLDDSVIYTYPEIEGETLNTTKQ